MSLIPFTFFLNLIKIRFSQRLVLLYNWSAIFSRISFTHTLTENFYSALGGAAHLSCFSLEDKPYVVLISFTHLLVICHLHCFRIVQPVKIKDGL